MEIADRWWTWFDNEDLNRTLQIALERNYDIAAGAARLKMAAAEARIAGADLWSSGSCDSAPA